MTMLMFIMLKKVIKSLNDKSKEYFIKKIQNYDELIEVRSKQLESINERIKNAECVVVSSKVERRSDSFEIYYEMENPSYEDDEIFRHYKKINENFTINNKKIIIKFMEENLENNDNKINTVLRRLNNKLEFKNMYKLILLDEKRQLEFLKSVSDKEELKIVDEYSKDNFNILDFKRYLENLIQKTDPTVYVKVGDVKENYDYLGDYVKTIYDDKICKGIMIIYKNKLYDFSLS